MRACYNAVLTIFWSVLGFLPICMFCYPFMERFWLYVFSFSGLFAYLLPVAQFRHLELSDNATVYRSLGVHWINRFVQHGTLINGLLRQRDPRYRRIRSRQTAVHLKNTTYMQERFHWAMFIVFLLSALYAFLHNHPGWGLLIMLTNLTYNMYPIWLQQYIRIRLRRSCSLRNLRCTSPH